MVRALVCGTRGRGFETRLPPKKKKDDSFCYPFSFLLFSRSHTQFYPEGVSKFLKFKARAITLFLFYLFSHAQTHTIYIRACFSFFPDFKIPYFDIKTILVHRMKTLINAIREYYRNHTTLCNLVLLFSWMIVNLVQAAFTGLANDEAYYWMYSKNIDYGYFDHPPAIALLIKAGFAIFQNELGVRCLIVLTGTLFIWFAFLLTNRRNFPLFFIMFCSVSCFEAYGFIAVPDAPLLFFTAVFFLLYKRWLKDDGFINSLLLGLNIAALLYCKYHGLLILFFTLLSNPGLLKNRRLYLVILISVTAYLPHIIWQVRNDYPSYQFHVLTKSQDPYKLIDTFVFIMGQLMIAGPLISLLLFYAAFRNRIQNLTERAMKYTFVGFIIFFLFSTLNAPVEANWTVTAFVPIMVLSYNYITSNSK